MYQYILQHSDDYREDETQHGRIKSPKKLHPIQIDQSVLH